ncbi:MAG: hypothetical protein ACT4QD_20660 [Acidobacteriota bacterium]
MNPRTAGWALWLVLLIASNAVAQTRPVPRPRQLSLSAGIGRWSSHGIGELDAQQRRNTAGTPAAFTLFRTESAIEGVTAVDARAGWAFTRVVGFEVGASYARPSVGVKITGDSEAGSGVHVRSALDTFILDLSGVVQLPGTRPGARWKPYAIGGGGYLRQLHEDRVRVESGRTLHGGAGVRLSLREGSRGGRVAGVRGEARYVRRWRGVDLENRSRGWLSLSALVFAEF